MLSRDAMNSPFDYNGDGRLDIWEQTAELMFLNDAFGAHKAEMSPEEYLEDLGYTLDDLREMDPDEIRSILEDAGYEF